MNISTSPELSEDAHQAREPATFIARARHKGQTAMFNELHVGGLWLEEATVRRFNPATGVGAVCYLLAFG